MVGKHDKSLETILYLFSAKLLAPCNVFLVRGPNETRKNIQPLEKQCRKHFGQSDGKVILEAILKAFARMPLAAVVEEIIYCAHGGVPKATSEPPRLSVLRGITEVLDIPEDDYYAWQMMTNIPYVHKDPKDEVKLFKLKPTNGPYSVFYGEDEVKLFKLKPTNGPNSFFYGEDAVDKFMRHDQLDFIIQSVDDIQHPKALWCYFKSKVTSIQSFDSKEPALIYYANEKITPLYVTTDLPLPYN